MEFCFYTKWNILKFDTKQGTLVQVTNFQKGKEKEKVEEKESFWKISKELFQFIRDQEAKKNGIRQKPMKINPTFNPIIMVKILLKV
jgi:hypothetical protein